MQKARITLLDNLIDKCFARYSGRFLQNDYFLTHHELEMVAELKEKRVRLLNSRIESDRPIGRDETLIWWEGTHFERCEVVQ